MKSLIIGVATAAMLLPTAALAQQPAATPLRHGAAIPGVCIYSFERVVAQSTAGQALAAGMQRLEEEVRAELTPYATTIQSEQQQLAQMQQSGQQPDQARIQQYQQRLQEAGQLEQTREAELRYTQITQTQVLAQSLQPIVTALYQERNCSILLDRGSVLTANPEMDLTEVAVQRLNSTLPSMSFTRQSPPAQAPGGQPGTVPNP